MSRTFPVDASGLDQQILTHLLHTVDPAAEVADFTVLAGRTFNDGGGKVSTAGRAEIELTLADGRRRRAIIKLCRPDAPLQPLYRNEVAFYTVVQPVLEIEVPTVLGAEFDEPSGTFALMLEDLREREARFPDVTTPVSLDEVRSLLDVLASLHARFWQNPELLDRFACIKPHVEGDLFRFFMAPDSVPMLVRAEIAEEQFKREWSRRSARPRSRFTTRCGGSSIIRPACRSPFAMVIATSATPTSCHRGGRGCSIGNWQRVVISCTTSAT